MLNTKDRNGTTVEVGTKVRVLKISESVFTRPSDDEAVLVRSMEGESFAVYEIDEWGGAWVEKWWSLDVGESISHSLGLEASEMEVIVDSR